MLHISVNPIALFNFYCSIVAEDLVYIQFDMCSLTLWKPPTHFNLSLSQASLTTADKTTIHETSFPVSHVQRANDLYIILS